MRYMVVHLLERGGKMPLHYFSYSKGKQVAKFQSDMLRGLGEIAFTPHLKSLAKCVKNSVVTASGNKECGSDTQTRIYLKLEITVGSLEDVLAQFNYSTLLSLS